jgi:hypothetical protein
MGLNQAEKEHYLVVWQDNFLPQSDSEYLCTVGRTVWMRDRSDIWLQSAQDTNEEGKQKYVNAIRGIQIYSPKFER